MTSRQERNRLTAVWVLAPLTAGLMSVTTEWALHHDPLSSAAASAPAAQSSPPGTASSAPSLHAIEAKVAAATRRYETTRLTLIDVERRIHATAQQIASVKKGTSGARSSLPSQGGAAAWVPPVRSSTAAPAPAPPPVNTSTGAS